MLRTTIPTITEPDASLPSYAHARDAGADLRTPTTIRIDPHGQAVVKLKVRVAIPERFFGWIASRSGLAAKGVTVEGGIIDSTYRGELGVILYNHTDSAVMFEAGSKIAQLIILPYAIATFEPVDALPTTERGEGGFGSTGA